VFCSFSCSVARDTLGLYCSVNKEGMKLDLVSEYFTSLCFVTSLTFLIGTVQLLQVFKAYIAV
jgi:hypothetical protein